MAALMVWSRFSAWSKTIEAGDSKTSSVTSRAVEAPLVVHLAADLGLGVVQGGQAVHELHLRVAGRLHELGVDLVGQEQLDPLAPLRRRARPSTPRRRCRGSRPPRPPHATSSPTRDPGARVGGPARGRWLGPRRRASSLGGGDADVHAEQRAGHQQRVGGVVAGVAQVAVGRPVRAAWRSGRAWSGRRPASGWGATGRSARSIPARPAYWPRVSTVSWANPRYSMPSNIRPSTRAVSLIDSPAPELGLPRARGR